MKRIDLSNNVVVIRTHSCENDPRVIRMLCRYHDITSDFVSICFSNSCIGPRVPFKTKHFSLPQSKILSFPFFPQKIRLAIAILINAFRIRSRFKVRNSILHCCDLDGILIGYISSFFTTSQLIYDVYDRWATMLSYRSEKIKGLVVQLEKFFVNRDKGLVIAPMDWTLEAMGMKSSHLKLVINNAISKVIEKELMLKKHQIIKHEGIFTLVYSGRVQGHRMIETAISSISKLDQWKLILQGPLDEPHLIINRGFNASWFGHLTFLESLSVTSTCTAVFACYDPGIDHFYKSDPNKFWEAGFYGLPVITNFKSGFDELIIQHGLGIVVEWGDEDSLLNALESLSIKANRDRIRENWESFLDTESIRDLQIREELKSFMKKRVKLNVINPKLSL
jgi:glycosyltransferase involved in cell wall biosynthesis